MSSNHLLAPNLVLGIGNVLQQDDGIGVHLIHELQNSLSSHNIRFVDGGTMGIELLGDILESGKVILIDAIRTGEKAGTVFAMELKDYLAKKKEMISVHQLTLFEALHFYQILDKPLPPIQLLAVEVSGLEMSMELSDEVTGEWSNILRLVKREITRFFGVE